MHKVFIDGQAGATGLELAGRLGGRDDIELLHIPPGHRKDAACRARLHRAADVAILCLPDVAARAAVALAPEARFIDASTAHRLAPGWTYGLPELTAGSRAAIAAARWVANPGCYPTGFVLSVRPLIDAGLLAAETPLSVNAVSGYSGGGKGLIAKHEGCDASGMPTRAYALRLDHKHVPEMRRHAGTAAAPLFAPMVGHYFKGIVTQVPLFRAELRGGAGAADVHEVLAARYAAEPFVKVLPLGEQESRDDGFLDPTACNDSNRLELMVFGGEEHVLLASRFDNLGKGAAGAAVQNLNLMLGLPETTGLAA